MKRFSAWLLAIVAAGWQAMATAGPPNLRANDVTWLWPAPQAADDLQGVIAVASLVDGDGAPVWSDSQFEDILRTVETDAARVGPFKIQLPDAVKSKDAWRIAAFRADPTAPGSHELIRKNFGEKPQLRLVLQPVTADGDGLQVHDIAVHLVFSFMVGGEDEEQERPDRERFRQVVADLDALKKLSEDAGADTDGPLRVHPGLKADVPGLREKVREFLGKHLRADRVDAMALMALDGPEPWIFIPLAKFPPGAERFGPIPFLPAQALSFRSPAGVLPSPRVNNLNPTPSGVILPAEAKDRRGVATAALFDDAIDLDGPAVIGSDEQGAPIFSNEVKNGDIPDVIAHPNRSHFFNTDCLSCHTETTRRLRFGREPGPLAFRERDESPAIAEDVLPKDDWNVRNLGWFPPSIFVGGGPTVATVTQRTANETAEVVAFIEREYRDPAAETSENGGDSSRDNAVTYFPQGWTADERLDFYFSRQGSQLLPYSWFLCLERAGSEELLRSDSHMRKLGFIAHPPHPDRNPDGLSIGFVLDRSAPPVEVKEGFLGPDFELNHYPTGDWLGLTCAACHTSELTFKGETYRVDGGAAMADVETLLSDLAESLRETATNDEKFQRFEQRIREAAAGDIDTSGLRVEVAAYAPVIEKIVARNKAAHPYGLGRLDAFGAILNQICEASLGIPENHRESNAPVSYPFLWDTPMLDWVQWNSSVEKPIFRNVGEVLGVFAHAKLTGSPQTGQFQSSARLDYLHRLEGQLRRLREPRWPQAFGEIDVTKAAHGKELFEQNCAKCHNVRDENGNFAMTPPNSLGHSFIRTTAVPFKQVGTDPQMILNFITRTGKPGDLAPVLQLESPATKARIKAFQGAVEQSGLPPLDLEGKVPAAMLLGAAVGGVIESDLATQLRNRSGEEREDIRHEIEGYRDGGIPPLLGGGYKARPLNGIWATAPYGHAGAVPNLYQWLLPEDRRVSEFHVGSREFDPIHVGFVSEPGEHAFHFRTHDEEGDPIPGNSNRGHSGPSQTDFTDEQRWQLIEYLKTQ